MPKWPDQTAGIIPRQIITEFLGAEPIHPAQGSCCAVADKDVFWANWRMSQTAGTCCYYGGGVRWFAVTLPQQGVHPKTRTFLRLECLNEAIDTPTSVSGGYRFAFQAVYISTASLVKLPGQGVCGNINPPWTGRYNSFSGTGKPAFSKSSGEDGFVPSGRKASGIPE